MSLQRIRWKKRNEIVEERNRKEEEKRRRKKKDNKKYYRNDQRSCEAKEENKVKTINKVKKKVNNAQKSTSAAAHMGLCVSITITYMCLFW